MTTLADSDNKQYCMNLVDVEKEYDIIQCIGEGTYGTVFSVVNRSKSDKTVYALKIFKCDDKILVNPLALREVDVLKKMDHNNIIKLYKVFFGSYKGKTNLCILLKIGDCDLRTHGGFKDERANMDTFLSILDGLNYMNNNGYYHGDLSLDNIIMSGRSPMIADFGCARRLHRQINPKIPPTITVRPIELFNEKKSCNNEIIDSWALGCILYYLYNNSDVIYEDINTNSRSIILKPPNKQFIEKLGISEELVFRGSQTDISTKGKSRSETKLLNTLLQYNPNKRLRVSELITSKLIDTKIKKHEYVINTKSSFVFSNMRSYMNKISVDKVLSTDIFMCLIDIISNIIHLHNLEDELLFLTIHNFYRIYNSKLFNETYRFTNGFCIVVGVVIFWITNKLISSDIFSMDGIIYIIKNIFNMEDSDEVDIRKLHNDICECLDWNLDPQIAYAYIHYIPEKYRAHYKFLNLILLINGPNEYDTTHNVKDFNEFLKAYAINRILKSQFRLKDTKIDTFITDYDDNFDIAVTDIIETISDIQRTDSTDLTCLSDLTRTVCRKLNMNRLYDDFSKLKIHI